jgi:hypothetical protein
MKTLTNWQVEDLETTDAEDEGFAVEHYVGGEDPYLFDGFYTEKETAQERADYLNAIAMQYSFENSEGNVEMVLEEEEDARIRTYTLPQGASK